MKTYITSVVRAMGGDEKTGADHLTPTPVTIDLGAHKAKFKFPRGSPITSLAAPQISSGIFGYLAGGGDPTTLDEETRQLLTPPAVWPLGGAALGSGAASPAVGPARDCGSSTSAGGSALRFPGYHPGLGA